MRLAHIYIYIYVSSESHFLLDSHFNFNFVVKRHSSGKKLLVRRVTYPKISPIGLHLGGKMAIEFFTYVWRNNEGVQDIFLFWNRAGIYRQ